MRKIPPVPFVTTLDKKASERWLAGLRANLPVGMEIAGFEDHAPAYWRSAELAIVADPKPDDLKQLPQLKWVQGLWAGVETLLPALPTDIAVVRMTDPYMAKTMAEAVLTLTLYLHRNLPAYAQQQRELLWQQHQVIRAEDRKVTVLGLGEMGRASCLALAQHGFHVSGWSRSPKTIPNLTCFHDESGLIDCLSTADILVVLLPLTPQTTGLLDKARLAYLKNNACLINFARAPIVDTEALIGKLRGGTLKHAVLDVFALEPLPKTDALWTAPNITILPHISAPTTIETASKIAAQNIRAFIETGQIPESVDRSKGY